MDEKIPINVVRLEVPHTITTTAVPTTGNNADNLSDTTVAYVKDYCKQQRDKNVKEYRRKLHQELSENITLHGYRQLVSETGWRKVSWIIVMTIMTSFAVYLFYEMLTDYGYKTVLEYDLLDGAMDMNYPTITLCTNSPAYTDKHFHQFPLNVTLDEFKNFYREELSSINYQYPNISARNREIKDGLAKLNITTYKSILQLFENSVEDTAEVWTAFTNFTCYLGHEPCNFARDFRSTFHWKYSLCYQWNYYDPKGSSKKQTKSEESFTMLLNLHANNKLISYYPFYGLVLYIHPYGTPHHLSAHTDSVGLQSGIFTSVEIERTEVNLLPVPYSTGCVPEKELSLIKNYPYSRAVCEIDCVLKKVYDKCGCVGFDFEGQVDSHIPICTLTQMKCYNGRLREYKGSCTKHAKSCPRECTYYKYHFQRSLVMNMGDEIMHEGFQRSPGWNRTHSETDTFIRQNLLGFEIGYKRLSELKENYKPSVSFSEVVGVVGGSIGLCVGFSFVTGYEFLFFLFDYITAPWKYKPLTTVPNGQT